MPSWAFPSWDRRTSYPELFALPDRLMADSERGDDQNPSVGMPDNILSPYQLHRCFPEAAVGEDRRPSSSERPFHEVALELEEEIGQIVRLETVLSRKLGTVIEP